MKHFIIGTAGHIDHGKTSLVKALTQIDCDTHQEEKKRGITINLGFAHLTLPDGTKAGIIDVPGHKDFIHTMISGAGGIDLLLLVIAADEGIMPQTLEHIEICKQLGIKKAIVALSKADLCDNEWIELLSEEITSLIEENGFVNAPVIPCSSVNGTGIQSLLLAIQELTRSLETRNAKGNFRMYIDRVFNPKGLGFVVTGSVLSGKLDVSKRLWLLPGNESYGIRGLQRFGENVDEIQAGDRAAINLNGFKAEIFEKGMVLCDENLENSSLIDASIELSPSVKKINRRSTVLFLSGTYLTQATMYLIGQKEASGKESVIVQIHLEKPGILMPEDRFILRNTSGDSTIGGGFVMDAHPLHHKRPSRKTQEALEMLRQSFLEKGKHFQRFKIKLEKEQIPFRLQGTEDFDLILNEIEDMPPEEDGMLWDAKSTILAPQIWVERQTQEIISSLSSFHQKNHLLDTGQSTAEIAGKSSIKQKTTEWEAFELLLNKLLQKKLLKRKGNQWQLSEFKTRIDSKDKTNLAEIEQTFLAYGTNKPLLEEVEESMKKQGINKEKLLQYLKYLVENGILYHIDKDFIHYTIVDLARKVLLEELKRKGKGINEGEFRVLFNGTKKIVHPLIDLFEKEGIIKQDLYIINITELGLTT